MEVHIGSEQFFVNPVAGSLWVRDLDNKTGRVVVEGTRPDDPSAQFQGGTATCDSTELLVVFPFGRAPTKHEQGQIVGLLRAHVGQAPIAFVLEAAEGRAIIEISDDQSTLGPQAAAAVAVIKASWAWDESQRFEITVNGTG
jgi:hypothetical protein